MLIFLIQICKLSLKNLNCICQAEVYNQKGPKKVYDTINIFHISISTKNTLVYWTFWHYNIKFLKISLV